MKKLFITSYMLLFGATKAEAIEAYRTANQAYRYRIVKALKEGGSHA